MSPIHPPHTRCLLDVVGACSVVPPRSPCVFTMYLFLNSARIARYFSTSDASEFVDNKTAEACPHAPTASLPFVVDDPEGAMLQLLVADNCFTCTFWVATRNGALDFTVPAGNTSDWALIIPQLAKDYPGE